MEPKYGFVWTFLRGFHKTQIYSTVAILYYTVGC